MEYIVHVSQWNLPIPFDPLIHNEYNGTTQHKAYYTNVACSQTFKSFASMHLLLLYMFIHV
jgi:hypothetical protein